MTELTIEVRAERATRKRNKKIAALYPLLADQLAVTVESQVARLQKQETDNATVFERWKIAEIKAWEHGLMLREVARQCLPAEDLESFDFRFLRMFGPKRWQDCGAYLADWWWCSMRDMDVEWCWDNCPNEILHDYDFIRKDGRCPTCHKPLTPPEPEPAGPVQIAFL
jgi:hypothetical protein